MQAMRIPWLLLGLVTGGAVQDDVRSEGVDALFADWVGSGEPGACVTVVLEGEVVHEGAYGEANLELGVPLEPTSTFYMASVSKQFVAFAVALLEADGVLSLDDDVREFVPELPDYGTPITLAHLVHHTSGLRDYLNLQSLAGLPLGIFHDDRQVLDLLARQRGLNFTPGRYYSYSNSGYFLLAVVVHRASGKSLREFAEERLFGPLGMTGSHFHDRYTHLIPRRASGYLMGSDEPQAFLTTFDRVGSGGLYSNVRDLVLWERNLEQGTVGGPQVLERMATRGVLNDGTELTYALGQVHGFHRGLATVSHGGALGGYRTMHLRFPEQRLAVYVLANRSDARADHLARSIADLYLPAGLPDAAQRAEEADVHPPPPWTEEDEPSSPEIAAALAGDYHSPELGVTYRLTAHGESLTLTVVERAMEIPDLTPVGPDRLRGALGWARFQREGDAPATGFLLSTGRANGIRFDRVD